MIQFAIQPLELSPLVMIKFIVTAEDETTEERVYLSHRLERKVHTEEDIGSVAQHLIDTCASILNDLDHTEEDFTLVQLGLYAHLKSHLVFHFDWDKFREEVNTFMEEDD